MKIEGGIEREFTFEGGVVPYVVHVRLGVGASYMLISQDDAQGKYGTIQIPVEDAEAFFRECAKLVRP